jgi:hypothetical protein
MESDLKSLQQKILDLENKLQFNHTSEEDIENVFIPNQNVQFDLGAFHSLLN